MCWVSGCRKLPHWAVWLQQAGTRRQDRSSDQSVQTHKTVLSVVWHTILIQKRGPLPGHDWHLWTSLGGILSLWEVIWKILQLALRLSSRRQFHISPEEPPRPLQVTRYICVQIPSTQWERSPSFDPRGNEKKKIKIISDVSHPLAVVK